MESVIKIYNMVSRDSSGAVFFGLDSNTQQTVALRKMFPYGPKGAGLNQQDEAVYDAAIGRLSNVEHAALRPIRSAGCDPVNNMPYLASDWIEGISLHELTASIPLSTSEVIYIIHQALDVCKFVSKILGKETIWVETDIQTIFRVVRGDEYGVVFWLDPLKCLDLKGSQSGSQILANFTEKLISCSEKNSLDHDSQGLIEWLEVVRSSVKFLELVELEAMLIALTSPPQVLSPFRHHPPELSEYIPQIRRPMRRSLAMMPHRPLRNPPKHQHASIVISLPHRSNDRTFFSIAVLVLIIVFSVCWNLAQWNSSHLPLPAVTQEKETLVLPVPKVPEQRTKISE